MPSDRPPIVTLRRALTLLTLATSAWIALIGARSALKVHRGLRAEYFDTTSLGARPAMTVIDDSVSVLQMTKRWEADLPDVFRVQWFGYLTVHSRTSCTFALTSDDGSTLTIDGQLLVDNSGRHGPVTRTAQVDLTPQAHPVLIEYEQLGGGLELSWTWACDGAEASPVPAWMLSPDRPTDWKIAAAHAIDIASTIVFAVVVAFTTFTVLTFGARPAWTWACAHPSAVALGCFVVLTLLETWPLATDVAHLSRTDNADAVLLDWVLAWVAHQAPRAPLHVFDTNAFYPDRNTLAFSEAMLVQSAMAAPIIWAGGSPVLAFNLVTLAGFALSGWAMYLVIARWTGSRIAGLTAGVIYAFNSHSFTRLPHLQAQHTEFLPLALYALDRLLRAPVVRNALKLALWFSLEALTSIYLLVLTTVALTVAFVVRRDAWRGPRARRIALMVGLSAAASALLLAPYITPYWRLYHERGLERSLGEAMMFSAVWRDYVSTPARYHYRWWSYQWFSGSAFFPGVVGLLLTGVAIARRTAFTDARARMGLAAGIAGVVLSFGPKVPGYATLYALVPLLHSVRVVSRFGFLAILAVAMLAGFGAAELRRGFTEQRWRIVGPLLVIVAALELYPGPLELTRFEGIPRIYASLRGLPGVVSVEIPFYGGVASFRQAYYMLNSTVHWQPILNGYSGLHTLDYQGRLVERLADFPAAGAIRTLREAGVTHVFVHVDELSPEAAALLDRSTDLELVARQRNILLFRVSLRAR
jgi:PA14 domain